VKEANLSFFHQNICAFRKEGFARLKGMESKMRKIKTIAFIVLTLAATLALQLGTINFITADSGLNQVTVQSDGMSHEILTGAKTVTGLMHEIGLTLYDFDRISHAQETPIWNGMTISIERAIHFSTQIDDEIVLTQTTWPNTRVEQILIHLQAEQNLPLIYRGNCERQIICGETLHFSSLRSRLETETKNLSYETLENSTRYVWQGRRHIRQIGSPGELEITTKVVYIGGVEQHREVVSENILAYPIDAIIDIGTGQLGALANVNAPDFHYVRRVRMEATAYTAGFSCTGRNPGDQWYRITASGREVEHGIVAVDRNVIPLGTRLYVQGYGFALAADVGGAIRGNKIDLFMECIQDARRFGRRHLYVWILE